MVGRRVRRVAAVIAGQEEEIAGAERVPERGNRGVEAAEIPGEPRRVASVSVLAVEVDEIRQDEVVRAARTRSAVFASPSASDAE